MRVLKAVAVCLFVLAAVSNLSHGAADARSFSEGEPALAGRVVDASGQPVANARIVATPLTGLPLRQALRIETQSNTDGFYRFADAFVDVDYSLEFWASGYLYQHFSSRPGSFATAVLNPESLHSLSGTVRLQRTGEPAGGAEVVIIGERGYRAEVLASDDGRFEFTDVPDDLGQGVLYARSEGLYSQHQLVRRTQSGADLTLSESAFIQGRCVVEGTNEPIPGCRVTARPPFLSGLALEAVTDEDGTYRFGPVPLGDYIVYAQHSQWFQPPTRGDFLEPKQIRMVSGINWVRDISMREKSCIEGAVFGPDGAPAANTIVAVASAIRPVYDPIYALGRTDANGRYVLYTYALHPTLRDRSVEVAAFSDTLGAGAVRLTASDQSEAAAGEYGNVNIDLGGRMHIYGHVTDTQGMPLSDVLVYLRSNYYPIRTTDASGFYDLGWFPLPADTDGTLSVTFKAPRPHDGNMNLLLEPAEREAAMLPEPGAVYVLHKFVTLASGHNRADVLDVALSPTDLLTFSGTVTDASGVAVSQAQVMLFAGNAQGDDWIEKVHPERMRGRDGFIVPSELAYLALSRTVTDESGRFAIHVARESRESLAIVHPGVNVDLSLFSLGIEAPDGSHRLVTDLRMSDGEASRSVNVRLP